MRQVIYTEARYQKLKEELKLMRIERRKQKKAAKRRARYKANKEDIQLQNLLFYYKKSGKMPRESSKLRRHAIEKGQSVKEYYEDWLTQS